MERKEIEKQIKELEKRLDAAKFQARITTQLLTKIDYEQEIEFINRKIERLNFELKKL